MAVRRADLGPASAYALAVSQGYTGTESEWAQALASVSTSAQTVAQASGIVTRAAEVDSALDQIDRGLQMVTTWTTGANMIDPLQAVNGRLSSAGTAIGTETTHKTTGWIPVQPMTSYTVKKWSTTTEQWGVVSYAQRWTAYTSKDLSTAISAAASEAAMTFTTPEGAAFVRFSYGVDHHGALCMAPSASFPEAWEDYGRQYSYAAGIATQAELETAQQQLAEGIDGEATAREAGDQLVLNGIGEEETARQEADQGLQADIDAEAATRAGQVTSILSQLEAESNTREAADERLQGLIAGAFDEMALYDAGAHCIGPDGNLYRFTAAHSGEWSAADVTRVSVGTELVREDTRITTFGGQVQQLNTRVPLPGTLSAGTYHLVLTVDAQGNKSYTWEAMA